MKIRDRIKTFKRVPAKQLVPNPKNWRTHPEAQADALRGVLADVGIAQACVCRELEDKTLMIIDGHLRAETMPDTKVPVIVLDVTEEEADRLLATMDPLAALAGCNADQLESLLTDIGGVENEAVGSMLERLAVQSGISMTDWEGGVSDTDAIGEYNADEETACIRIKCNRATVDEAEELIKEALDDNISYELRVF